MATTPTPASKRRRRRFTLEAHFDRSGGTVRGSITVDPVSELVEIRAHRARDSYRTTLGEIVDLIVQRQLRLDAIHEAQRRRATRAKRRRDKPRN